MADLPHPESGLLKAGRILLLVGAILHTVGAVLLLVASLVLAFIGHTVARWPLGLLAGVYGVLGVLLAVGSVFGFSAVRRAKAGRFHGAFVHGLVSSLLPPLQVVTLLGAIFLEVCPESEAAKRAQLP